MLLIYGGSLTNKLHIQKKVQFLAHFHVNNFYLLGLYCPHRLSEKAVASQNAVVEHPFLRVTR